MEPELKIPEIENKVLELEQQWDEISNSNNSSKSNFNWFKNKIDFSLATKFLLFAVDQLIITIDNLIEKGSDKKSVVLSNIDKIYDYIVREGLPIWMMPFASNIKYYIIYVLVSSSIDYFVSKYRNKEWNKK